MICALADIIFKCLYQGDIFNKKICLEFYFLKFKTLLLGTNGMHVRGISFRLTGVVRLTGVTEDVGCVGPHDTPFPIDLGL